MIHRQPNQLDDRRNMTMQECSISVWAARGIQQALHQPTTMDFGEALTCLRNGDRLARRNMGGLWSRRCLVLRLKLTDGADLVLPFIHAFNVHEGLSRWEPMSADLMATDWQVVT